MHIPHSSSLAVLVCLLSFSLNGRRLFNLTYLLPKWLLIWTITTYGRRKYVTIALNPSIFALDSPLFIPTYSSIWGTHEEPAHTINLQPYTARPLLYSVNPSGFSRNVPIRHEKQAHHGFLQPRGCQLSQYNVFCTLACRSVSLAHVSNWTLVCPTRAIVN